MARIYDYLPDTINIDGVILMPYVGGFNQREVVSICKNRKVKYRIIKVLSLNLRGKTDLHGQPYNPSQWVFTGLD
jgi:hypothetical protein